MSQPSEQEIIAEMHNKDESMDPEADMDPEDLLEIAIDLINDAEDIDDIDQVIRTLELAKTKM